MTTTELRELIPRAIHRCTDQANANRLADAIGFPLVSVNRKFYALVNGAWWPADELVAQRAAQLPDVIAAEAPDKLATAEKLAKWARRSARKATAKAAVEMLRGCSSVGSLGEVNLSA